MVNVQYYCFLTNIITKTKICESETTFFNFVNLPKREKIPLKLKLKAGAIPTIFPETEAYKASKKAPLNPNDLGPGKHNRAKYGAYSERNRTHIHHVWKSQMSVKKCLVNSRLFGSVILNHILIMCIRSHHRHLRRLYFGQQNTRDSLSNHRERTLLS
ncbi:hypothetical protein DPMN_040759 [Dreissena polymorpha]|uniref:Uncharacterized protein n=1 Tax=Dreissena polymorpha TaxID=45954 RepID=A0A9D4HTD5_DREPO|nr:hypothetical protein DPMN_040759 [Dreissena polymorpha]